MKHKDINEIIRELREDQDMEQAEVAQYLGISQQTYSNYERGRHELPTRHLITLANLFQVNADYILGLTTYRGRIDHLYGAFTSSITIGSLLSDLMKLDSESREEVANYIAYLETKQAKK